MSPRVVCEKVPVFQIRGPDPEASRRMLRSPLKFEACRVRSLLAVSPGPTYMNGLRSDVPGLFKIRAPLAPNELEVPVPMEVATIVPLSTRVEPVYVLEFPRIRTPAPFLITATPPDPAPLRTPERIPAVTMVPVLPLLLTVIVLVDAPIAMSLVISVSPRAVPEPKMREVGLKFVPPQVREPPPRVTTSRSVEPAAKPEAPPVSCTLPDAAPRVRVKVPEVSNTPPLMVRRLPVGRPAPSTARSAPPEMVVAPV